MSEVQDENPGKLCEKEMKKLCKVSSGNKHRRTVILAFQLECEGNHHVPYLMHDSAICHDRSDLIVT